MKHREGEHQSSPSINHRGRIPIMMLPCYETYKRMVGAAGGVWPETVNDGATELAIKLTADLAKAVLKGAPVTLVAAVIPMGDKNVRMIGAVIEDNKSDPVLIHGPQELVREQETFDAFLEQEFTFVTFFDELVRPIMAGRANWCPEHAKAMLSRLTQTQPHFQCQEGDELPMLAEAMNIAEATIGRWHRNDGSPEAMLWVAMPLHLDGLCPVNVSSPEAGTFTLDDPDEGGSLEMSAYLLLEANFPGTVSVNPEFDDGPKRREFCDILVVGKNEVFIVQSKVMAMLERNPEQTTERRAKNVYSNFRKAVSQLCGSVRTLRQGRSIYAKDAEILINENAKKLIHGIVLLSSTSLPLPWSDVSNELIAASRKSHAEFHVLEFGELQQHVAFGKTLDEMSLHLSRRYMVLEESGNANTKMRFLNEKNRPIRSAPIDDNAYGYVFTLEVDRGGETDPVRMFKIFKAAINRHRFTGKCEYFQNIGLLEREKFCWIGLGLQWERAADPIPSYDWWIELREEVRPMLDAELGLKLTHLSEMGRLGDIRGSQTLAMVIEFVDGRAVGYFDPDKQRGDEQ
jgi:hypothetical protein